MLWVRILFTLFVSFALSSTVRLNLGGVIETDVEPEIVNMRDASHMAVKLKCIPLNGLGTKNKNEVNEIYWEHVRCGSGLHLTPCNRLRTWNWKSVMCKNSTKLCDKPTLKLENLKQHDSGFYRCLYKNYMSSHFKVFKLFLLEVSDPEAETLEILEEPASIENRTVSMNDNVVFRCRVRSMVEPLIVWAKLRDSSDSIDKNRIFLFKNQSFEILNNSVMHNDGMVYTKKLRLENCQMRDSGHYYCIVIQPKDMKIQSKLVHLTVNPFSLTGEQPEDTSASANSILIVSFIVVLILLVLFVLAISYYFLKVRPHRILRKKATQLGK